MVIPFSLLDVMSIFTSLVSYMTKALYHSVMSLSISFHEIRIFLDYFHVFFFLYINVLRLSILMLKFHLKKHLNCLSSSLIISPSWGLNAYCSFVFTVTLELTCTLPLCLQSLRSNIGEVDQ